MMLYKPIHEGFVRYCSARTYGIMETEDLVQDSIAFAYERFDKLRDKKAFLAYLMRTANNLFINQLRKKKFKGQYDEQAFERLQSQCPSPEMAADIDHLYRAISRLPSKSQEAILLFEISGFKVDEIAQIQNKSVSAVKVNLHRSRKQLRKELEGAADLQQVLLSLHLIYFTKH